MVRQVQMSEEEFRAAARRQLAEAQQEIADLRSMLETSDAAALAAATKADKLRGLLELALHDLSCTEAGSHTAGEIYAALDELDGTGDSE